MTSGERLLLVSGDLSVCPERGEVRNGRGESARLGPVNMKVLAALMSRPGQVVSRAEIYDAVWHNQVVGDDTLTRSISDIRAEINRLSEQPGLIETLPKRGYRWTADVRRTADGPFDALQARPLAGRGGASGAASAGEARGTRRASGRRGLLVFARRIAVYAVLLVLIASAAVWVAERLSRPGPPVVALLPIAAEPAQRELATAVEQQISAYLVRFDRVKLLAPSAVESRPSNPFPYFSYQFGASWLIEGALRRASPKSVLTVDIVDARTGIVLSQSTAVVGDDAKPEAIDVTEVTRSLVVFFESHEGR